MENFLSVEENEELNVLRTAISEQPSSVHFMKMERFSELLVKSLQGKGETSSFSNPTNF